MKINDDVHQNLVGQIIRFFGLKQFEVVGKDFSDLSHSLWRLLLSPRDNDRLISGDGLMSVTNSSGNEVALDLW